MRHMWLADGPHDLKLTVPRLPVLDRRHHLPMRHLVAAQLVGDQHPRRGALPLEELAEELLGRSSVSPGLDQDVKDVAVLVHGAPQVVAFAVDPDEHLVHMPRVTRSGPPPAQLVGVALAELGAPVADRLVGDHDAALEHHLRDVPQAQREAVVEPDAVADDLHRVPVPLMSVGGSAYPADSLTGSGRQVSTVCPWTLSSGTRSSPLIWGSICQAGMVKRCPEPSPRDTASVDRTGLW